MAAKPSFCGLPKTPPAANAPGSEFEGVYGYYAVRDPKPGAKVYARFSDPDTKLDDELPIYMAGLLLRLGPRLFCCRNCEMWRVREVDGTH